MIDRLDQEGRTDLGAMLRKCGLPFVMRTTCCFDARLARTRCKHKWCPSCARGLAAKRANRLQQVVQTFKWPLFLTLTMRNVADLNGQAVRDLRRSFGRFRRMKAFGLVAAGVASIEVTNIGNGWHPHLHAVLDAEWLGPQRTRPAKWESRTQKFEAAKLAKLALEHAWARALRQETAVIHVKRCDPVGILKEVIKYSVKGSDLISCKEAIGPLIDCLIKTRLVTTFGKAHGFKFLEQERDPQKCMCGDCQNPRPGGGYLGKWLPQELLSAGVERHDPLFIPIDPETLMGEHRKDEKDKPRRKEA